MNKICSVCGGEVMEVEPIQHVDMEPYGDQMVPRSSMVAGGYLCEDCGSRLFEDELRVKHSDYYDMNMPTEVVHIIDRLAIGSIKAYEYAVKELEKVIKDRKAKLLK